MKLYFIPTTGQLLSQRVSITRGSILLQSYVLLQLVHSNSSCLSVLGCMLAAQCNIAKFDVNSRQVHVLGPPENFQKCDKPRPVYSTGCDSSRFVYVGARSGQWRPGLRAAVALRRRARGALHDRQTTGAATPGN